MWQRFTERARRVVFFAQEEAERLGENYVYTEHLLLGMVRENDSVAVRLLDQMGVPLSRIRSEIERQVVRGDGRMGQDMQLTPRAKRVIDLAYDEARQLNNNYIGTEHLLLGIVREGEGLAGRIFNNLGVTLERTRDEVIRLQDAQPENPATGDSSSDAVSESETSAAPPPANRRRDLMQRLRVVFRTLLAMEPELAKLPPGEVLRTLTGDDRGSETAGVASVLTAGTVKPQAGDLGVLKSADGRAAVEVAVDGPAYMRLLRVFEARDAFGYHALAEERKFFLLPAGTPVKLLTPPYEERTVLWAEKACYVRILDGEHTGRAGYIAENEFERTGPDESPFPPPLTDTDSGGEAGQSS